MNLTAWLNENIAHLERMGLSEKGQGALSAFRECLEQVDARSPTDEELDDVIATAISEGTPRNKVRRQLRVLFGDTPGSAPPLTDQQILDHVPAPVLEDLKITGRASLCAWVRRMLKEGRLSG